MKKTVVQHGRLVPAVEERLAEEFDVIPLWQQADPVAWLRTHGAGLEAIAGSARVGVQADIIDALPRLRVIASLGVGFDSIDVEAARRRGVAVSYTPDVLNDCVADLAWGAMLDISRGLSEADRFMRRGEWPQRAFRLATRLSGKKLGIVGLGRIGRAIAKRGIGFDMDIRCHTRRPLEGVPWQHMPDLNALARWADYLMVAVAGGEGTRHLVSAEVLRELGPDGYLINVARGSAVDELALTDALQSRAIAGAALDVFASEPCFPEPLARLDNVVLLPHVGTATHETRAAMGELVISNLHAFFDAGRLLTPIPEAA